MTIATTPTLIQYSASVSVTDSRLNDSKSSTTNSFDIAVLAVDKQDATALITQFYSVSGLAAKTVNGVHTIFRQGQSNLPGAIRQVKVISLYQTPVVPSTPAPTSTLAPTITSSIKETPSVPAVVPEVKPARVKKTIVVNPSE